MRKRFNVNGLCYPDENYMVNLDSRAEAIKKLVDERKYFVINKARQYGKTTILNWLKERLMDDYAVFSISFEGLGENAFVNESEFCQMFCELLHEAIRYDEVKGITQEVQSTIIRICKLDEEKNIRQLSNMISDISSINKKPIVLMIDEVDQASNHKVFLDFLGMLRNLYLRRKTRPTFYSVILAGVYDIKNLKQKIRTEGEHQYNSPWNIAADFNIDMSFSVEDILSMLKEYDNDHKTGIDLLSVARTIYDYTSGYPYLVSRICKLIDEKMGDQKKELDWSGQGVTEAVSLILRDSNTLFDDMAKKVTDFPELRKMLYEMLFEGQSFPYNPNNQIIGIGNMFGFIKNENGQAVISNRIFETWFYNLFISEESLRSRSYKAAAEIKNQFIKDGRLDMEQILVKFMNHFSEIYGDCPDSFKEENGRRLFLLYLKPIINGTGDYYVEAQTRNQRRTDVIVDYLGEQYIIELKIWHGNEYHKKGEEQLADYLDSYNKKEGYLISFNFNKNKESYSKVIKCRGKKIFEVVI